MSTEVAAPAPQQRMPAIVTSRGIHLETTKDLQEFANCVAKSGLAPKGMENPNSIVVAIEMGLEVGLRPMQALQNIAVINGRPSVWGDAALALCQNADMFDQAAFRETIAGEGDNMVASCTVRRLPDGEPTTRTFSVADAKTANLWKKAGPWMQYPRRMLQMRARGFALRDTFPDVLRGLYIAEELQGMEEVEARVSRVEALVSRVEALVSLGVAQQQVEQLTGPRQFVRGEPDADHPSGKWAEVPQETTVEAPPIEEQSTSTNPHEAAAPTVAEQPPPEPEKSQEEAVVEYRRQIMEAASIPAVNAVVSLIEKTLPPGEAADGLLLIAKGRRFDLRAAAKTTKEGVRT